ncbi:hypothetical protein ACTD5D_21435 [Nocardia takedensis]|uniref:hypothetical protein n=1 Tax=Nocardia takedensis TaxID=259390 RepID=UPI003F75B625
MGLWRDVRMVMIVAASGWPTWCPIELFVVTDHVIPETWEFCVGVDGFGGLWGYPTLIRDPDHNANLSDRRRAARAAFLRESGVRAFDPATKRFTE